VNSEKGRHLHPKVQALADLVTQIAEAEIEKVKKDPATWFSKILVFNKLISGTAPHLRAVLTSRLDPLFDHALEEHIAARGWPSREKLAPELRKYIVEALADSKTSLSAGKGSACAIPAGFTHDDFRSYHGHHFIDAYRGTLVQRPEQALFLFHCVRTAPGPASSDLRRWVREYLVQPLEEALRKIIDDYLDDTPRHERRRMSSSKWLSASA